MLGMNGNGVSGGGSGGGAGMLSVTRAATLIDPAQEINPYLDLERLRAWLRQVSDPKRKKDKQCWHFVLTHEPATGGLRMVTQESIPKPPCSEPDRYQGIDKVVELFSQEAETTAAGNSVAQRFFVEAHTKDDRDDAAWAQTTFLIAPKLTSLDGGLYPDAEPQTGQSAVIGHLQRLTDTSFRLLAANMQECMNRSLDREKELYVHQEKLTEQLWTQRKEMEELLDRKDERTLNVYKGKLEIERTEKLYAAGMSYVLPLLGRWLGGKLPPELTAGTPMAEDSGSNPMLEFAKTLTPPQLLRFAGDMSPEQQEKFKPIWNVLLGSMSLDQKAELERLYVDEMRKRAEAEAEAAEKGESQ